MRLTRVFQDMSGDSFVSHKINLVALTILKRKKRRRRRNRIKLEVSRCSFNIFISCVCVRSPELP